MFEPVFESLRKATDATVQMQQELLNKWVGLFPGVPGMPAVAEPIKFQKRFVEIVTELTRKQRESLEAQFNIGVKNIEETFRLCEAKGPEELRARTIELWQKTFESLRQIYEAQVRDCQAAVARWGELIGKAPPVVHTN